MKTRALIVFTATSFCMGCANISTLNRTTSLPKHYVKDTKPEPINKESREVNGLAIHLDAPQRLVFAKNGIVCAEPSPDALQAYAASQSLSVLVPQKVSVALANALAANSGSIGLRTQSITLMRDHLFRICEAAYSGFLTEFDVAQLIRRSQDLTLGVLAIEQLSGAVKAQQVAISTRANADASANLAATQDSLAAAREKERLAKEVAVVAEEKKTAQAKLLKTKQDLVDSPPAGQNPIKLQEDRDKEQQQLDLVTTEATDAKRNHEYTQKVTKRIEENLGKAMITATDAAEGESKLLGGERDRGIDSNTAKYISCAAVQIVDKIVNKNHIVDSCISLINRFAESELDPGVKKLQEDMKVIEKIEAQRDKTVTKKNKLEDEKEVAVTKFKSLIAAGANTPEAKQALVAAEGEKEGLLSKIGQLQEKRQILDRMIDQRLKGLGGITTIREQCIRIITTHLKNEEKERDSRGDGAENGKKNETGAVSGIQKQECSWQ